MSSKSQVSSVTCLKGCKKLIFRRGLCQACYGPICRAIREGKTTWEKEEKAGRVIAAVKAPISYLFGRGRKTAKK